MSHEQSETIQLDDGTWANVYGRKTPKAGQRLPDTPTYPTMDEAVSAAKERSRSYVPNDIYELANEMMANQVSAAQQGPLPPIKREKQLRARLGQELPQAQLEYQPDWGLGMTPAVKRNYPAGDTIGGPRARKPYETGNWKAQLPQVLQDQFPNDEDSEEEKITKIMKLLMLAPMGRGAAAAKPAMEGAFGIFGSPHRIFGKQEGMERTIEFIRKEAEKMSPQKLWEQTGVARGAEGRTRAELPQGLDPTAYHRLLGEFYQNSRTGWPQQKGYGLGAVLRQEMDNAYPELGNRGTLQLARQEYRGGGADPLELLMHVGLGKNSGLRGMTYKDIGEHELQHLIQGLEKWNQGGNPASVELFHDRIPPDLLLKAYRQIRDHAGYNTINHWLGRESLPESVVNYMRLGGEVEARNAARRAENMRLQKLAPQLTEDVPRHQQLVQVPGRTRHSAPKTLQKAPLFEGRDLLRDPANPYRDWDQAASAATNRLRPQPAAAGKHGYEKEWKPHSDIVRQIEDTDRYVGSKMDPETLKNYLEAVLRNK